MIILSNNSDRRWRFLSETLLGALAYAVLLWLSLAYAAERGGVTAVSPAIAVALAMIVRRPPGQWFSRLAACLVAEFIVRSALGPDILLNVWFSATNILEVFLVALWLRRWRGADFDFGAPTDLTIFAIIALSVPWLAAVSGAPFVLLQNGGLTLAKVAVRAMAHGLGFLVFAPAFALVGRTGLMIADRARRRVALMSILFLVVSLAGVFGQSRYPLLFLVLPAILALAFQFELEGAAFAILATALVSIVAALAGVGPTALIRGPMTERALVLQIFLATCTLIALPLASVVRQRRLTLGSVAQTRDEAIKAHAEAREMHQLASMAERLAGMAYWRRNVVTGAAWWSPQMFEVLGLPPGDGVPDNEAAVERTHPRDRDRIRAAMTGAMQEGISVDEEATFLRLDGEERTFRVRAEAERDADGALVAVFGALLDITDIRRTEAALKDSEARFRSWADNSADVVIHTNQNGRLSYISPSVERVIGYRPDELIGWRPYDLVHPDDAQRMRKEVEARLRVARGAPRDPIEYRIVTKSGDTVWVEARPEILLDPVTLQGVGVTDIVRDITQRKRLEEELVAAKQAAEAAAEAKSDFLANMSHELRTPLTAIIGFAGILAAKGTLGEMEEMLVKRIGNASRILLSLINDVLDISKFDAGQIDLETKPTDLRDLAQETVLLLGGQAKTKGLDLNVEISPSVPRRVLTDPNRLTQVISNLLSNAIKFTATGSVTLKLRQITPAQVRFEVCDTGMGIAADRVEKLFARFVQADSSTTRLHGGTGLGLSICKAIVEVMGGRIGVESKAGHGSTFWFELPLAEVAEDAGAAEGIGDL